MLHWFWKAVKQKETFHEKRGRVSGAKIIFCDNRGGGLDTLKYAQISTAIQHYKNAYGTLDYLIQIMYFMESHIAGMSCIS